MADAHQRSASRLLLSAFSLLMPALVLLSIWAPAVCGQDGFKDAIDLPDPAITAADEVVNTCCAFLRTPSKDKKWQLVCSPHSEIPGAEDFPPGSNVLKAEATQNFTACSGTFPTDLPEPYKLPLTQIRLFDLPTGDLCAGKFTHFYQLLSPKGDFVVHCY